MNVQRNFDVLLSLGLCSWIWKDEGCGLVEGRPLGAGVGERFSGVWQQHKIQRTHSYHVTG